MVVFACSACGESLKKNQVENHYMRKCRNCNMLSCLDCGKDFWGDEYVQHTKCISEEEKYSGKNYVPKPGSNKNEVKQQQWLQQVQEAVDKCRTNPRLKAVLLRLKDQPNVPRKKNKFLNFLANGFGVRDSNLASQVWDMLMAHTENKQQENNQSNTDTSNETDNQSKDVKPSESNESKFNTDNTETNPVNGHTAESESKKLSKREKKEERRKKLHKEEKKDKHKGADEDDSLQERNGLTDKVSKKMSKSKDVKKDDKIDRKSKKRKREVDEEGEQEDIDEDTGNQSVCNGENGDQSICDEDTEEPAKKKIKTKFRWNDVIVEVLQTKGPEMKIKKLKKKVLSEYLSQGCSEKSEEKLWSKFDKKLKKIPEVKVIGEKVRLKNAS